MGRRYRFAASCLLVFATLGAAALGAQVVQQRTPPPTASADATAWYMSREPILFAGNVYYPAGVKVNFNGNEMIPSGYFEGITLYTRTTIEPYSIVYVPLVGGLMQPYERPRTGDVAGTASYQAPGPQALLTMTDGRFAAAMPTSTLGTSRVETQAVGMAGGAEPVPTATTAAPPLPAPGSIRRRPSRIFVEFGGERYFTSGVPVPFDAARFVRLGDYHGFPVYADARGASSTIYIPISSGLSDVVAPYVSQRGR